MLTCSYSTCIVQRTTHVIAVIKMGPPSPDKPTCLAQNESAWHIDNGPKLPEAMEHLKDSPALPIYEVYRLNQAVLVTVRQGTLPVRSRPYSEKLIKTVNAQLGRGQFTRVR